MTWNDFVGNGTLIGSVKATLQTQQVHGIPNELYFTPESSGKNMTFMHACLRRAIIIITIVMHVYITNTFGPLYIRWPVEGVALLLTVHRDVHACHAWVSGVYSWSFVRGAWL